MHRPLLAFSTLALTLVGCKQAVPDQDSNNGSADDTAPEEEVWPEGLAPLTEPSSGECPDLSASATVEFTSSGEQRTVTAVVPDNPGEDMQVVFFFHGLMSPQQTPNPTEYMAQAMGLQQVANQTNAVILLPESPVRTEFGQSFYLWDVESTGDADLVLYDDLRACVGQTWDVDYTRLSALGFSGGALFTTIVASQRSDTLSTFVEMSGGADYDTIISEALVAEYQSPVWPIPALLFSGGANDAWPDPSFAIIQFSEGSDVLQQNLADDGHFVVHCRHNEGHTLTNAEANLAIEWLQVHTFGEASPYEGGVAELGDWCEEGAPEG